jgi:glycosyltransferase involved in cell wall biosynthesis
MACYDDFNGVYFSVQALQLYHAEAMRDVEVLVVDNCPDSRDGQSVRDFVTHWVSGGRYIAAPEKVGTAAPRELVFREAAGQAVLCVDSHVLIAPGAIRKLIEFYDAHPACRDLLHGPMLSDDGKKAATHMEPVWRCEMFGVWGFDPRGDDPDGPAFEIPMHGCGLMSCRKDAWLGFNRRFRGFGGEEGYIHEKFRQAGRKVLCLPMLRWLHRFGRPAGVPYPLTVENKVRNYLLGKLELGLPYDDVLDHFTPRFTRAWIDPILAELGLPSLTEHWFKPAARPSRAVKLAA